MNMFSFLTSMYNYESRKVGRDEFDWGFVSTCSVPDGDHLYETGVSHDKFREDGNLIIVEAYDTKEDAIAGHKKWVKVMTSQELPEELIDCKNAEISQLIDEPLVYKRRG